MNHHVRMSHPDAVSQWTPLLSMLHLPPETPFITQQISVKPIWMLHTCFDL